MRMGGTSTGATAAATAAATSVPCRLPTQPEPSVWPNMASRILWRSTASPAKASNGEPLRKTMTRVAKPRNSSSSLDM